jgi:glycopeptide antibiotics resistance protein
VNPATGERHDDVIVFRVPIEGDKLALLQDDSSPYFTTPHLDGHLSLPVRAGRLGETSYGELAEVVQALVPLVLTAFVAMAYRLQRVGAATAPRLVASAGVCGYGAGVLKSMLLPMPIAVGAGRDGFESWRLFVNLTPVVTGLDDPIGLVLNVALFVPLGVLLPLLLRAPSVGRVVVTAFLVSMAIELLQLGTGVTVSIGRIADVDDLIANTAGALLGYAVFRTACLLPGADRVIAAATWPSAALRREPTALPAPRSP